MRLSAGDRLGSYEILDELGRGGMGSVYRARDTRLGREVAIKISAERFNERFEREARVVASLNHPNICTLYDVGPNYLVMELIEGESPQGPLPLEAVLDYARQMADALDYAHEHGVTHRDLKPGNLKITPDGKLKVLDFGLAKLGPASPISASTENSPTLTIGMTEVGVILGTAAYMAPEQAKGKPVDKRADIWAFGVVLYELSTGKRLFQGEDVSDTLASVLKEDPDLAPVPERLRPLLTRCLQKDPKKRLRDIADAMAFVSDHEPTAVPQQRVNWLWPALAGALALTLAATAWKLWPAPPQLPAIVRFDVALPGGAIVSNLPAVSPDGRYLVIPATTPNDGQLRLYLRTLDSPDVRQLPVTDLGGGPPFWSFDSRWVLYPSAENNKLKRASVEGGEPLVLTDGEGVTILGITSNREGTILYAGLGLTAALRQIPATGGPAKEIPLSGVFPSFLPDGNRFVYRATRSANATGSARGFGGISIATMNGSDSPSDILSLAAPGAASRGSAAVQFVPSMDPSLGWVLYVEGGTLFALPLDSKSGKVMGEPVAVAPDVSAFSASKDVLALDSATFPGAQLAWIGPRDVQTPLGDLQPISGVALSPKDEDWAAVAQSGDSPGVWLVDLQSGRRTRFSFEQPATMPPVWSANGEHLAYGVASGTGTTTIYRRPFDASRPAEAVAEIPTFAALNDWSPDQRYMLVMVVDEHNGPDVVALDLAAKPKPKLIPLVGTRFAEGSARFSPDGNWISYLTRESGRFEVCIRTFVAGAPGEPPVLGPPLTVSKGNPTQNIGATEALTFWSRDSRSLTYVGPEASLMRVDYTGDSRAPFGAPKWIGKYPPGTLGLDIASDGRLLVSIIRRQSVASPIKVVLNWQTDLLKTK